MENNLKILFFGTPEFAMPVLETLVKNGYNVSHFQSKSLKNEQTFKAFKLLNPDLCVVAAYGKILPSRYLEVPKYGFLNVHPSLLPKYRGPSTIQTAILNGDIETGVTIMVVDEEVDHGPMLAQKTYNLQPTTYNLQISKELFELGAELLIETLPKYISGEIKPEPQDHSQATFTKMFSREDGRIDWEQPAEKIYNQIRALNPEPGTWTTWRPRADIAHVLSRRNRSQKKPIDKIINIKKADLIDGKISVQTIQVEGRKEMSFKELLN